MPSLMASEHESAERAAARQFHDDLLTKMPEGTHDAGKCTFCTSPRETAAAGGTMPEGATATVDLNDPSIKAVVEHRVAEGTADLRTRAETAERERDEARTRLDVVEAEKVAAETARDAATKERDDLKTEVDNERAAQGRKDERIKALREAAAALPDEFLTDERKDRIAKMTDEEFTDYSAEMAAAFTGVTVTPGTNGAGKTKATAGAPPRETAMATASDAGAGAGGGGGGDTPASKRWIGGVSGFGGRRSDG